MDIRCHVCNTVYHIDAAMAGQAFTCHNCRNSVPCPTTMGGIDDATVHIICAFCHHGFDVSLQHKGILACPACGKELDVLDAGATKVWHVNPHIAGSSSPNITRQIPAAIASEQRNSKSVAGCRLAGSLDKTSLGTTWMAEQLALKRQVVVFLLDPQLAADDKRKAVFLSEARKAAHLAHPHIAQVYDAGCDTETFVVSQVINGESLSRRTSSGRLLTVPEAALLGSQLANGLSAAHGANLCHCGLCSNWIILDSQDNAWLTNFGINRALEGMPIRDGGREHFLAPEQLTGGKATPISDLYSLGVVIFQALTGKTPYTDEALECLAKGEGDPKPDFTRLPAVAPPALITLLQELLSVSPDKRPASANAAEQRFIEIEQAAAPKPEARPISPLDRVKDPDRRQYKRIRTEMNVKIAGAGLTLEQQESYILKLGDISENGAFLLTSTPLPTGAFVKLMMQLEGAGAMVEVLGIVRWRDFTPGNVGMGVQFLEVSTSSRDRIRTYVDEKTAGDIAQQLCQTALHRQMVKQLHQHWGQVVPIETFSRGTGTSRMLLTRVLSDLAKLGLVALKGDQIECIVPRNPAMMEAIEIAIRLVKSK